MSPGPRLELRQVEAAYASGAEPVLRDICLSLESGQMLALIGPNGAGKSTLFNAVAGSTTIAFGRILLRGDAIHHLSPHAISARGVRRTFQNGGLFAHLTALENVLVGLHTQVESSYFGLLLGASRSVRAEAAATRRARELLALMEVEHVADRLAAELSSGQQRMVEIVRALATDPPLLLLDEPAVGLAPPMRERLGDIIRRLAKERRIGIVLIEHAIELVMTISDRVVVLNYGRKVADAAPAEVRADKNVLEAYLGHA